MPKNLKIAAFDVGQGESALVIAQSTGFGQQYMRTMLIDGGLQGKVTDVNTAVIARLQAEGMVIDHATANTPAVRVNSVVISHFDADHSGGIVNLLAADNLCALCYLVTGNIDAAYGDYNPASHPNIVKAVIAALVYSALNGGYIVPGTPDPAMTALLDNIKTRAVQYAAVTGWYLAGKQAADDYLWGQGVQRYGYLIPTAQKISSVTRNTPDAFANNPADTAHMKDGIFESVFSQLRGYINPSLSAWQPGDYYTYGLYSRSMLVDTGHSIWTPSLYPDIAAGKLMMSSRWIQVPGVARTRMKPNPGTELLWLDSPAVRIPSTAADPEAYVFSCDREIWNPVGPNQEIAMIGIDNNAASIGMIIRFEDFWFYTGGDLPAEGENHIAYNIAASGILTVRGEPLRFPGRLAAFKCGHHGAGTCTDNYFLNTLNPVAAVISCGWNNSYYHPSPYLLARLNGAAGLQRVFLTEMFSLARKRTELPVAGKAAVAGNTYFLPEVAGLNTNIYGDILIDVPEPGPGTQRGEYNVTYSYTADPVAEPVPANHRFGVDYNDLNVVLHI